MICPLFMAAAIQAGRIDVDSSVASILKNNPIGCITSDCGCWNPDFGRCGFSSPAARSIEVLNNTLIDASFAGHPPFQG